MSHVKAGRVPESGAAPTDLAGALHEVSNTLTVVLGWLDAAKEKSPEGAVQEAIEVALAHARLGHSIARRAIGAEVGDDSVTRSALSVARDAALGVAQEAQRARVHVEVGDRIEDDLLVGAAPVAQQILINLLLNAIHFSPPQGKVTLVVEGKDGLIRFRVIDCGPGIPEERVEALFRSPESTRRGGAGIGLRHAHALAEQNGGVLALTQTSTAGTEFELEWPVSEAPSRALRTVPPRALDGLRILLLEDDPAVQALVDLGLSTRGAAVATASTARDLGTLILTGVFDVVLLDLSPLGDQPDQTLATLKARHPDTPVVVISGSVAPTVDAPNIAAWVRKPFEIGELVEALLRVRG